MTQSKIAKTKDGNEWDQELGLPGIEVFSSALQVWSAMNYPCSVEQAAKAFNTIPQDIVDAIRFHPWMFLEGPGDDYSRQMIEHEGE